MDILTRIQDSPAIEYVVRNPEGIPDISSPAGARELIYSGVNNRNTTMDVSLHIDENNMLSRMILESESIESDNVLRREAYFLPPLLGQSATPPPRAAWTRDLYAETSRPSVSTRPRSDRSTPPEAPPAQRRRIATPPQAQAAASPEPMPMPRILDMAQMRDFHQNGIHVIEPPGIEQPELAPAAHDDRLTVEDGIRDADGSLHYYLEKQTEQSCAQHAVNAMLGGPFVSFNQFVQHELRNRPANTTRSEANILDAIARGGVEPESVLGVLHGQGFATTAYRHVPAAGADDRPVINWEHLAQIDDLDTDRLLMHASTVTENSHTGRMTALGSHFVAFRRDSQTRQWVLLDSVRLSAQTMAPLEYLRDLDAGSGLLNEVTVIAPRHRLRLAAGAVAQDQATQAAGPSSGIAAPPAEQQATAGTSIKKLKESTVDSRATGITHKLTYLVTEGNSKSTVRTKNYYLSNFASDAAARAARQKDIESIENGTFVPPPERHRGESVPGYPELTWFGDEGRTMKNHCELRIKTIDELKGLTRNFTMKQYGDKEKAVQAAIEELRNIKENPHLYKKLGKAEYQSIVRGVHWSSFEKIWVFGVKGPDGKMSRTKFSDADHENPQLAAEQYALDHGAHPATRAASRFAPGLRRVPPVIWNHDQRAFMVTHGEETRAFKPADYSNDLLAARTAAESHATEIAQAHQDDPIPMQWRPGKK
ncbi:hypothetical protein [Noviherbaspirillum aerium]|uniref:hypothetical protein n=1 Tax=Noviherbaspirillum aerium TaxID=2588497 RepID=UPI00124C7B34|nr:hypothetical protein [Noviherbaspirillum aerium]